MSVTKLDLISEPFEEGRSFGDTGPYELLSGTAHFALDAELYRNQVITDLELAPRSPDGRVHFSADFSLLRPQDPARGNRTLLMDIPNRGRTTVFRLNHQPPSRSWTALPDAGDGWVLRQGYAIGWCGWQHDVIGDGDFLGINAPEAQIDGKPVTGRVSCTLQPSSPTRAMMLANLGHRTIPALDVSELEATLIVRPDPWADGKVVSRENWSFSRLDGDDLVPDPNWIYYPDGFQAGQFYEAVYTAVGAPLTGIGLAATRDIASFLRHSPESDGNPGAGRFDFTLGFGVSQGGTFLRQMLYLGLCEDAEGRLVFDGILSEIAGGRRGAANWRFGQPSVVGPPVPGNLFPYAGSPQTDPTTGKTDAIQMRASVSGKLPKIVYANSSAEYWVLQGALIHTDLATGADAESPENERIYHFAGTQHGGGFPLPLTDTTTYPENARALYFYNSINYQPLVRAALVNLAAWVRDGRIPPASKHPKTTDGTAVPRDVTLKRLELIPGVRRTEPLLPVGSFDYGQETKPWQVTKFPPDFLGGYPDLVPAVDSDGNDLGGIRLPDIEAPLATYTGWNARHSDIGGENQPIVMTGATIPFPVTAAARQAMGDPRPSIDERYESKEAFLAKIREAAVDLVRQGYMLEEDVELVVSASAARYDEFTSRA
ncbi:MAG: hypothetical protein IIC97_09535 [Chloroflexi bacterium]|nr:hypothetical protein [Chloroflexota bacterium]